MQKKILVVDDEILILESLQADLEQAGYIVGGSSNGEEALVKLAQDSYNLLITDLMMDNMDGIELIARVRELDSDIPIIIITGYVELESAIAALRLGAEDYLHKPYNHEELLLRIKKCLEKQELLKKVRERTKELEEVNIALKVLLQKRNEAKKILGQQILDNVTDLIEPYLFKLEKMTLTADQQVLIDILKTNIKEITSPFSRDLSLNFTKLTPAETQVANLIKQGKRTKDIGLLLNLSPGTISIHRKNIRKKLGLTNQRVNLQFFLSSYSH